MYVHPEETAEHVGVANRMSRRFVKAARIAQQAFDEMIEQGYRDIGQQQTGDGLVDAAVLPKRTRECDPQPAQQHGEQRHCQLHQDRWHAAEIMPRDGRGQSAEYQRAFAADDHQPCLRRQRDAERGEDQRRGAHQRILPGEGAAERALVHERIDLERILAQHRDEDPEQEH